MALTAEPITFIILELICPSHNYLTMKIKNYLKQKWLEHHSSKENLTIFHYTNMQGLTGIIQQRCIRMTHITSLNDPEEFKYGENLILAELEKRKEFIGLSAGIYRGYQVPSRKTFENARYIFGVILR